MLLTGGLSTRMGRDKATLVWHGQPLWIRQLELLRRLRLERIWISARQTPAWAPADVQAILDVPPSRGPLSGIAAALARLTTTHLLVLAVDLPNMTAEHMQSLLARARPARGIVPENGKLLEPLCAVYPKEAAPIAAAALSGTDRSMKSFARELLSADLLDKYDVQGEGAALYLNLNAPNDLPKPNRSPA